jgi:phosphoribosylaminoimidazole carboxylase PurE protein
MVASLTTLPVIGVPIDITTLKGLDAFLSIALMPRGVPVATVGVDNAENAAHLAVRILAANEVEPRLQVLLEMWAKSQRQKVRKMNILLQTLKPRAPKRIQRKSRLRS